MAVCDSDVAVSSLVSKHVLIRSLTGRSAEALPEPPQRVEDSPPAVAILGGAHKFRRYQSPR